MVGKIAQRINCNCYVSKLPKDVQEMYRTLPATFFYSGRTCGDFMQGRARPPHLLYFFLKLLRK